MELVTVGKILVSLALLTAGAEALVRGAVRIAAAAGISALVIGLTIVAFGTSTPELVVSLGAALSGNPDIAVGNVVGSNIFNTLFILGVCALVAPLMVSSQLIRLDVPVMILASLLLTLLAADRTLASWEGVVLALAIVAYVAFLLRKSRTENQEVKAEFEREYVAPPRHGFRYLAVALVWVGAGLALLIWGGNWLVEGATALASALGVSDRVIGLTIVAAGTSLPEVATSVVATMKGERDIAIGNVVGSNIYNIFAILGLTALVAPGGLGVQAEMLAFDIPVMLATAVLCLPVFFSGMRISRSEGAFFLACYVAYTWRLISRGTAPAADPGLLPGLLNFVLPAIVLTVVILLAQRLRGRG